MAKQYLSSVYSGSGKNEKKTKTLTWYGIDYSGTPDSGYMTRCENCMVSDGGEYVQSEAVFSLCKEGNYSKPLSIHAFSDFYLIVYKQSGSIKIDYVTAGGTYTCTLGSYASVSDESPRTIIRFNAWDGKLNIASTKFKPKLLVYPDMYSFDFVQTGDFQAEYFGKSIPKSNDACVHLSRVFSIAEDRIFATGTNYADYRLDTADDYSEAHAWGSLVEGNTHSDGKLTAITSYDGHVVAFKSDFCYEIYNTKNPFRVVDVYRVGTVDKRSVKEVGGKLYFASSDGIYCYSGGIPRCISDKLCFDSPLTCGVAGVYDDKYYLYNHDSGCIYIYNTQNGMFGAMEAPNEVVGFASNDLGLYMLCRNGKIYLVNPGDYYETHFCFETDIRTMGSLDNKRIKEIRFLAYGEDDYDSSLTLSALYEDGDGNIDREQELYGDDISGYKSVKIPVRGRNTGLCKLKFSGSGKVRVFRLEIIVV